MRGYPPRFLGLLWAVCAAVIGTGLLLLPTTLALRLDWTVPWRLPGGSRVVAAASHAAAAFAMLLVAGALWSIHMRAGWRRGRQRLSGGLVAGTLLGLALSAIGVYYVGESSLSDTVALVHVALGLAITLPLGVHIVAGRARRSEGHRPARQRNERQSHLQSR